MKKILLLSILFVAAFQLEAQQLFKFKPADSLSNYFKSKPLPGLQFTNPGFDFKQSPLLASNNIFSNNQPADDNMPIALFVGRDDMQVVKLRGYDRMPVLDLRKGALIDGPRNEPQIAPTFLTPGGQN